MVVLARQRHLHRARRPTVRAYEASGGSVWGETELSGTILAVDDSRTIRDLIEFVLTGAGYRTIVATDGKDALEKLGGIKPELVITDINMPKMNGYDFIRAARGIGAMQDVPILVLTTEFDEDIKSKVRELGANGWIAKPFNPTQLLETVKRVAPSAAAAA